jgi:tetratricopeptide (TPR) repeat protein
MRQTLVLIVLLALQILAVPLVQAESGDPSELFLNAYMSVQKGEKLEQDGKLKLALQKYRYAASLLEQIHQRDPDWQPLIVEYRKKKTSDAIGKLEKKIAVEGPGSTREDTPPPENPGPLPNLDDNAPSVSVNPGAATDSDGSDPFENATKEIRAKFRRVQQELNETRQKYADVQREKEEIAAKLEDSIKQIDLLRVNETQLKSQLQQAQDAYKNALTDRTQDTDGQKQLKEQIARLEEALKNTQAERDVAEEQNEDLSTKITGTKTERDAAIKQRDEAMDSLAKAKEAQQQVDKLMADNAALMQKLGDAEKTIADFNSNGPKKDEQIAGLKKDVDDAREQLNTALKKNQEYQGSISELQTQLEASNLQLTQLKNGSATSEERKKLVEENDLLRSIVMRERKEEARRSQEKKLILNELKKLHVQSDVLVEKINYLGQPVVKLTDKERALFKQPQIAISDTSISIAAAKPDASATPAPQASATEPSPSPSASPAASPSASPEESVKINEPSPFASPASTASPTPEASATPATSGSDSAAPQVETSVTPNVPKELLPLTKEAKEYFERGKYRDAEKTYETMLTKAPTNIYILSNLGVVRFRSGKLKSAEEAFRKAIAVAPDDAFSHCTLGIVYYSEGKYDEAVGELTRALAIQPKNQTAHNYLGITASAKGWQEAARKELETAVQIDPNYADAHFNLAVIYATTPPVDKESAKKHYKRAIELGAEPDPALEQLLNK